MEIALDKKTYQLKASTVWFDEDGIFYSVPLPGVKSITTREEMMEEMNKLREIIGNKKVCMIAEVDPNAPPPKREDREYIAKELKSITKALAMITNSPMSRMIANLFFTFMPPTYPTKMFTNEKDAKEWIKQYL